MRTHTYKYVCNSRASIRYHFTYFISFTNDFNTYDYLYSIRRKNEAFEASRAFLNEMENHLGKNTKYIRYDRIGPYMSQEFRYHLEKYGIIS